MTILRGFYKSEDIFLDLFEDEFNEMSKSTLNVEFLCMDATILLPPTGTPLTGIGFTRRLPCGEVEKARRAIRVFFYLRKLCQQIVYEQEALLPLTNQDACIQVDNILDLSKFCVLVANWSIAAHFGAKLVQNRRSLILFCCALVLAL